MHTYILKNATMKYSNVLKNNRTENIHFDLVLGYATTAAVIHAHFDFTTTEI